MVQKKHKCISKGGKVGGEASTADAAAAEAEAASAVAAAAPRTPWDTYLRTRFIATLPAVDAEVAASEILASRLLPALRFGWADAAASTLLAHCLHRPRMPIQLPPHSNHFKLCRPWMKILLLLPQSLHCDIRRPWLQMVRPVQVLALRFAQSRMQMDAPPQVSA